MTRSPNAFLIAVAAFVLASPSVVRIALAQTSVEKDAARNYIEGIEALDHQEYGPAVEAFTRAIKADGENEAYLRARGVALTLKESFADAIADLERAGRLDPNDMEARLWAAAAYRMSGDVAKGASLFTMRDLPHDYANLVYNLMAMQYWQSRQTGQYIDPATKHSVPAKEPVKLLFPEAARDYAQRHRATGAAAAAIITEQMKAAIDHADWPLAIQNLVQLRTDAPDDPTLRGYWALALVGAGDALAARKEFTRVLCVTPLWAAGYLGRAQAQMLLGDGPRAEADLQVAASLGLGGVDELRRRLSKFAQPPASAEAGQRFDQAVRTGAKFNELVDDALALHRLTNARRLRYDESYQLRIRLLSEAMRDHTRSADYPEMLGRFLFNYCQVPVVWDGPRNGGRPLRPQSPAEHDGEIKRALELCDGALKLDEKNANALATKGWILLTIKAVGAEALADRGLSIDPDNVRLLALKIRILLDHAAELEAQASGLRAGHTDTHREERADGVYEVRTYYPPTAEQLTLAAQLETQAKGVRLQAATSQAHLKQVSDELIPRLLKQGTPGALAAAYQHDPELPQTLQQLADLSTRRGDKELAQIYTVLANVPEETSAAAELKAAWDACSRTQWKFAGQSVENAAAIDPADARAAAYRSVIEVQGDHPDAAAAGRSRIAGLALEEARARLLGTTLLAGKSPAPDLIDLQQAGLALALRLESGDAELAAGRTADAIADYLANVALEKRIGAQFLEQVVPTAMLPGAPGDAGTVASEPPAAPTFASLLGASRLGLARAYLVMHQPDQAREQYAAVRAYLANWPATAPNRETMNIVDSWARLGEAESENDLRNYASALNILEHNGWPGGLPKELDARRRQLADQLHRQQNTQALGDLQRRMSQSPGQMRIASMQEEIAGLEKQRDTIASDLANPAISDRQRQVEQSSVSQLEMLIAQRREALEKLQAGPP